MRKSLAALTTAACALALLAGCGENTIDTDDLESEIQTDLAESAGVEPKEISCPEDIVAEEGRKFECELTAPDDSTAVVEVTLTDDEGGFEAVVPPEQFQQESGGQAD
jgi:hypothetical protein